MVAIVSSCSKAKLGADAQTAPASARANLPGVVWHYQVRLEAGSELAVEGRFEGKNDGVFSADDDAAPFMHHVQVAQGANWLPASKREASWLAPCSSGCTIRYRFALRDAARTLAAADTAIASGDVLISPPSTWLLHPRTELKDGDFELSVEPGPGARFVSAFRRVSDGRTNRYRARLGVLDDSSFAAFGPLQVSEIPAGDTTVQLAVALNGLGLSVEQARAWIADSAGAVASYYQGHLPARRVLVLLMQGSGNSTRGITLGGGGPGVLVRASDRVNPNTTRDDWVVTHELLHANFPDVGPAHAWLSEGLATYLEPIARARVGLVSEAKVWRDMVDGMPQGLPQAGDQGLENTRTWGRTYWGGAIFCLLADVELRNRPVTGVRSTTYCWRLAKLWPPTKITGRSSACWRWRSTPPPRRSCGSSSCASLKSLEPWILLGFSWSSACAPKAIRWSSTNARRWPSCANPSRPVARGEWHSATHSDATPLALLLENFQREKLTGSVSGATLRAARRTQGRETPRAARPSCVQAHAVS